MEPKLSIIAVETRLPISLVGRPMAYILRAAFLPLEICGNFAACLADPGLGRCLILDAGRWRSGGGGPGNNWHFARLGVGSAVVMEGSLHMKHSKILHIVVLPATSNHSIKVFVLSADQFAVIWDYPLWGSHIWQL